MRLIIIEGECKNTRQNVLDYFTLFEKTYMVFNFDKPPSNILHKSHYQFNVIYEKYLYNTSQVYGNNIPIYWNRSHLSEYVYSCLERGQNKEDIIQKVWDFEKNLFSLVSINDVYLLTFTGVNDAGKIDDQILLKEEFKDIADKSFIRNKLYFDVNDKVDEVLDKLEKKYHSLNIR